MSITLNRGAADNAGHYCDAGAELAIGDKPERNTITAERAQALLDSHGAIGEVTKAKPRASKSKAAKPKAKRAPKAKVVALPISDPVPPVTDAIGDADAGLVAEPV